MIVKYKININSATAATQNTTASTVTATSINIPIVMEFQNVDYAEDIQTKFVEVETNNAINPVLNYERVRFTPITDRGNLISEILYNVTILDTSGVYQNYYGGIGFTDDDIKFRKNAFKQTFLNLAFYDTNNAMTQRLVGNITLFSNLNPSDFLGQGTTFGNAGQPKPSNQIPINFVVDNPLTNPRGFGEGFYVYDYKDELPIGGSKFLYMKASFKNAKDGKTVNLMVKNVAKPINEVVNELYTRVILTRATNGYFYRFDTTYDGNITGGTLQNNVTYNNLTAFINLYQVKVT